MQAERESVGAGGLKSSPHILPSICLTSDWMAAGPPIILSMWGGSMRDICAMLCCMLRGLMSPFRPLGSFMPFMAAV